MENMKKKPRDLPFNNNLNFNASYKTIKTLIKLEDNKSNQ